MILRRETVVRTVKLVNQAGLSAGRRFRFPEPAAAFSTAIPVFVSRFLKKHLQGQLVERGIVPASVGCRPRPRSMLERAFRFNLIYLVDPTLDRVRDNALPCSNAKGRSMNVEPSSSREVYLTLAVVGTVLIIEMAAFALLG